ncbi:serine/threonine-protein kinase [Pseudofrankia inefficax]|nr:serine/threonine-protein kinase [Pseudofrankia inefficax]
MRRLGSQYVLHAPLGRGASGEVWRGVREADGSPVAVKILRAELTEDPEVVERFLRERRVLLGFEHPHLVRVRDLVAEGDTLAIVMDLVEGTDLRRYLRASGPLDPTAAVGLTDQVLDALTVVHGQGVVHRDVKPENILVDTTDPGRPQAMLTDFGIARLTYGAAITRRTGLIGTPRYMAPELSGQTRATPAADLYSLGIVLYELLSGRAPFDADHPIAMLRAHLEQSPAPLDGLPGTLWPTLARLLAKSPTDRPATAGEARVELTTALTATPSPGQATGPRLAVPVTGAVAGAAAAPPEHDETVLSPRPDGFPPPLGEMTSETALATPAPAPAAAGGPEADPAPARPAGARRPARLIWAAVLAAAVILTAGSWALAAAVGGDHGSGGATPLAATRPAATAPPATTATGDAVPAVGPSASAATGPASRPNHAQAADTPASGQVQPAEDDHATVPDVRKLSLDQASATLKQAGFGNLPYLYGCYADSPADTVVRQDPVSGTRAVRTDPVHLYLEANNCGTVPDVRGLTLDGAATSLKAHGLTNIPYVYKCLGSPTAGVVVSQAPAPGTNQLATEPVSLELQADNCARS